MIITFSVMVKTSLFETIETIETKKTALERELKAQYEKKGWRVDSLEEVKLLRLRAGEYFRYMYNVNLTPQPGAVRIDTKKDDEYTLRAEPLDIAMSPGWILALMAGAFALILAAGTVTIKIIDVVGENAEQLGETAKNFLPGMIVILLILAVLSVTAIVKKR